MKALVIGSSDRLRDMVDALIQEAFDVIEAPDSVAGQQRAMSYEPDIVIVDENALPADPHWLMTALKGVVEMPVIVVGDGDQVARSRALDLGADFYLSYGVSMREFMARVHALLRRHNDVINTS